jgi:hypothetical protein
MRFDRKRAFSIEAAATAALALSVAALVYLLYSAW